MENDLNPCGDNGFSQYKHDRLIENLLKNRIAEFIDCELTKQSNIYETITNDQDKYYCLGMIQAYKNVLNYVTY